MRFKSLKYFYLFFVCFWNTSIAIFVAINHALNNALFEWSLDPILIINLGAECYDCKNIAYGAEYAIYGYSNISFE